MPWDSRQLCYCVREPFPSQTTGTSLVFGKIEPSQHFSLTSRMAEGGIIFSDGIVADGQSYLNESMLTGESKPVEKKTGDKVIIDPEIRPNPGDYVAAKCCGKEEATFKKYKARGTDTNGNELFDLVPLNGDWETIHAGPDNPCQIIGTMLVHIRYRAGRK